MVSSFAASFKKIVAFKTKSQHKELTKGGKNLHEKHVNGLIGTIDSYGVDPFSKESPKCFPFGEIISSVIANNVLSAPKLGDARYVDFVKNRLFSRKTKFFTYNKNKFKVCSRNEEKEEKG